MQRHELAKSFPPENEREPSESTDAGRVIETGGKVLRGAEDKLDKIHRAERHERIKMWLDLGEKLDSASFKTPAKKDTVMVVYRRLQGSNDNFNSQEQFESAAKELASVIGDEIDPIDWWDDILRTSEALQNLFPQQTVAALKKLHGDEVWMTELDAADVNSCFSAVIQCAEELKTIYGARAQRFDQFIKEAYRQKESLPPTSVSLHAIGLVVQHFNDILAREIGVERDEDIAYRVYELMPLKYGKTLLQVNLLDRALVTTNQEARLYLDEYRTAVKRFNELIE